MGALSETWFADGYIDFELKKYTLLAYLQDINQHFTQSRLYPQLSDIIFHYNNLVAFRDNKQFLQQQFPKRLTAVNIQKLELLYEQLIADDELMEELESIIHYSLPQLNSTIKEGTEIYEYVAEHLSIFPVGLVPLETTEGKRWYIPTGSPFLKDMMRNTGVFIPNISRLIKKTWYIPSAISKAC
jgi:hypothetical protein